MQLGGKIEDDALQGRLEALTTEITDCAESMAKLQLSESGITDEIAALEERLQAVLPVQLARMLEGAGSFYQKDGPAFMASRDAKYQTLHDHLVKAEERQAYAKHFEGAQSYLDSLAGPVDEAGLQAKLAEIARQYEENRAKRHETRERLNTLSASVPALERAVKSLDKAAVLAIKKYRKVAQLSDDVVSSGEHRIDEQPLIEFSVELAFTLHEQQPADKAERLADAIIGELEEIDIDRKAGDLSRSKKDLLEVEKRFIGTAKSIATESHGLRPVERQSLAEVKSAKDIVNVRTLYEGLLEQLNRSQELLEQCESSEREARQGVSSRLAHLIDYAATDLDILRSVVGSNRGKHNSYFNVEAEVLERTGIQTLMEKILTEVDILEEQRRQRAESGLPAAEDDDYHESLRTVIRDRLYKAIFTNPKITYVNSSIRGAGDENEFNENLSEGQKAALSLMWAIRLAEFAIEREAKRLSTRRSQQKARDMSVNIMLVDGLFSNLSNRDLIDSSMAGIESTRGSFQLIGLIHNPHYQNDYEKFPVFIVGKNEGNGRDDARKKGWVSFHEYDADEGALRMAQIRRIPPSKAS